MSALPDSRVVAMTLDTKEPFPRLKLLLEQARHDEVLVALLIDLQGDYPLSMPIVSEWLAVLIDDSNHITCFAVVARSTRSRLMVTGLALAAKRRSITTPIDCFTSLEAARHWLTNSPRIVFN